MLNFKCIYLMESYYFINYLLTSQESIFNYSIKILSLMNSPLPILSVNLLPPDRLYCNFDYWSSLFSKDMQVLWDRAHGVPLEKLPKGLSDMIFPYLLLALSDYKTSQLNKMSGIGLDNLLSLWFDRYLLNKNGYFELIKK